MAHHSIKRSSTTDESTKDKLKRRKKESKLKLKEKRARLIIRNLPFETTDANLQKHFEQFGEIDDIKILKKEDGTALGCAFVQYKLVQKAAKARHFTNSKPFFGREISVDFALPKNKYQKAKESSVQSHEEVKIKEEPVDSDDVKQENVDITESTEETESDGEDEEEEVEENEIVESKPRIISNDVCEGKTVFVKNIPFMATNSDITDCFSQFGPVIYGLICMDKKTEHPKGTGFVKFRNQEDAEKALNAGTELTLMGNILDCHKALAQNDIQRKEKEKNKFQPKDNRNLYLVKEGVILAGSKAAEGVSESDMAKRLETEKYKTHMLRNVNMFISRERLVIYNLPSTWDDKKFKTLIQKHSNKNAIIKEARIMRDMRSVDSNGIGTSKEYGFVSFTKHEDAINLLRSINNNPNIFSKSKRPIVTFSIENKKMLKNKQKRLGQSQRNNPNCKFYVKESVQDNKIVRKNRKPLESVEDVGTNEFSGVTTKPGVTQKMRSRYKLKTQFQLHRENLKKEKLKLKFAKKKFEERKQDFRKQEKQKRNKSKSERDDFVKIVNDYKNKIAAGNVTAKKSKWYE